MSELDRLNKFLAHAGVGSRRQCDDLIRAGRITLDGIVVETLATKVAAGQVVAVDGKPIGQQEVVYWLVNKPKGHVCTNLDPAGRPRAIDLVDHVPQRVYTVGRLDEESEGLLLLTNDGDLAFKLTHPSYGVEKTYEVQVAGHPTPESLDKLTEGIWLSDGKARANHVKIIESQGDSLWIKVVLAEGKNREIRRMLAKLGHKVLDLKRVAIGPIWLDRLPKGKSRRLKPHEIELLKEGAENARKTYNRRGPDEEGEGEEEPRIPDRGPLKESAMREAAFRSNRGRSGPSRSNPGRSGPGRGGFGDRQSGPMGGSEFGPRPRGRFGEGEARPEFGDRRGPRPGGSRSPGGSRPGFQRDSDHGDFRRAPHRGETGEGFPREGQDEGPSPRRFGDRPARGPSSRSDRGPSSGQDRAPVRGPVRGGPGFRREEGGPEGDRPPRRISGGPSRGPREGDERSGPPRRAGGEGFRSGPVSGPGGRSGPGDRPFRSGPGRPPMDRNQGGGYSRAPQSGPRKADPNVREKGKVQRKGGKPAFRRGPAKEDKPKEDNS